MAETRVPLELLLVGPPVPAGCNLLKIAAMAYEYRATSEDREPALVTREGEHYRITDGRHRYLASLIAGRVDLLCEVLPAAVPGQDLPDALAG